MNPNDLLTRIEVACAWELFLKDWLPEIRQALRPQLGGEYRIFLESDEANQDSLIIRSGPENSIVAAMEVMSPSNKQQGRKRYLRKRAEYLDVGISFLELDALQKGERDLPAPLKQLAEYDRLAWTAYQQSGTRTDMGYCWNQGDELPHVRWQIDPAQLVTIDLPATLQAAAEFNRWEDMVNSTEDTQG